MRDNTPPRPSDIDEDDMEEIHIVDDVPPDDDDDFDDMEEVSIEELESRLESLHERELEDARSSPVPDDALLSFTNHTGPVFSCALHPQFDWAVTGGEDDRVFIWNTQTGEVMHEITEHQDTIMEVEFNHDGTYLASGDMAGKLLVHKVQDEDGQLPTLRKVWEYMIGDMTWLRWHRAANVLIAGSENGEVYVCRIPSGECKVLPGHEARCESGELAHDGKKLFTAYSNGVLKLWDLKSASTIMEVNTLNSLRHQEGVITVACDKDSPLYMSGGEDGKILFSTNNGPVASVESDGPVECIAFSPSTELKLAASGSLQGTISIWDYAKFSLRTACEEFGSSDGITKMKWLNDYTVIAGTLKGRIVAYDARTGMRKFALSGHTEEIYDFCFDARNGILLSTSEDKTAKIFKVPQLGN